MRSEIITDAKYCLASHIRYREVAGEGIVLDQRKAELIVVNPLGEQILKLLKNKPTFSIIIDLVLEEYDVDGDVLVADVKEYLSQLETAGIIEQRHD